MWYWVAIAAGLVLCVWLDCYRRQIAGKGSVSKDWMKEERYNRTGY